MATSVLVPVDGTEFSDRILTLLFRLADEKELDVTVLKVVPRQRPSARFRRAADPSVDETHHLEEVVARLRAREVHARFEIVGPAEPAAAIVDFAKRELPALIALATHGRAGLSRLLEGSVAEAVVHQSPCPVLLANGRGLDRLERGPGRIERILLPLDRSAEPSLLDLARSIADGHGAEIIPVNCVDVSALEEHGVADPAAAVAAAEKLVEDVRRALAPRPTRGCVAFGPPPEAIIDIARRESIDLVVMMTHGRTGFARWCYGSVTDEVFKACPCPVLVLSARASPDALIRSADLRAARDGGPPC